MKKAVDLKVFSDIFTSEEVRMMIYGSLADDECYKLIISGSAQKTLRNIQVKAVHRLWERLLLGKGPFIYRRNGLVQNAEITDNELESEDGTLSADHRYTNLLWKAQLSKTHPLLRDESDYDRRPLMIIIMFLGKPPFPKAARRRN